MKPLVSVIIPTYNRLAFLKEAIASVSKQTFNDYELIVVDDGSMDETPLFLNFYTGVPLKFIRVENGPRGVSFARNQGVAKAEGVFIAFLDSDDLWLPHKLEKQMAYFKDVPNVRVCQTEEIWIRKGVRVNPKKKHQKYSGWIFEKCLPLCIISPSAVILHREVFARCGFFDENLPACEDYAYWLRVTLEYPVETLSTRLVIKRGGHEDQLSRKYWGMDRFRIMALEKILSYPRLSGEQRKMVELQLQIKYKILSQGALKRGYKFNESKEES